MRVDVIDSFETLLQLRGNWDAVYEADPEAQFFTSWTWISGWFRRVGFQWIVLAAKAAPDARDYVGFFPLQLRAERDRNGNFHNELHIGGGYSTGYNGLICDPRLERQILRAFADHAKSLNWAKLHLENVFLSPRRLELFLKEFPTSEFTIRKVARPDDGDGIDHDIYVYVNLPGDWEAFLDIDLGAKTRRDARWALRQIDGDSTGYRMTNVTPKTIERDQDILLRFWENQWHDKLAARYNPNLPKAMMRNFRNMISYCFENDSLFLPVLWRGEDPIAAQASMVDRSKKSLIGLISGRDMTIKKPPPSFTIHVYHLRWAIQNGLKIYDLQTGNFSYKYHFGGLERRVECLLVSTATRRNLRDRLESRSLPVVLARANGLHQAGDFEGAARACRQILDADPAHAGALRLLQQSEAPRRSLLPQNLSAAARLHQAGKLAEAEKMYREILDIEPGHFDVRYLLGVIFLQQGRYQEAERQITQAIDIRRNVPAAHYNRGLALIKLDRIKEGLASLDDCIELEPGHGQALALRNTVLKTRQPVASAAETKASPAISNL